MNMAEVDLSTDVLIVGGGPAGSTTGISLAQSGRRQVMLIDKADFPRDKPCGDGLSPGVVNLVNDLGLEKLFDGLPACHSYALLGPKKKVIFGSIGDADPMMVDNGHKSQSDCIVNPEVGYVMPRAVFDTVLLDKARESGVEVLNRYSFKSLRQDDNGVVSVVVKPDKEEITIGSRILIGADGANSRVRSALGVSLSPKNRTGIAMRAYAEFATDSKQELNRIWIAYHEDVLPGYAWMFPFTDQGGQSMANIGVGSLVSEKQTSRAWFLQQLENFVEQLKEHDIHFSSVQNHRTYLLPFGNKLSKLVYGRTALIGDSASMINPLSGEGILYGMSAGRMLSQALHKTDDSLASDDTQALKKWEAAVRKRFSTHLRHCYFGHRLMRHPKWTNAIFRSVVKDPSVANRAIDLMFREGTLDLAIMTKVLRRF